MKKQYCAYVRVSTVKQGEHGSSLVEQKSAIEAYAARNGLAIVSWFEEMETAAKQGRREFSRLMHALKQGKADGLIIHKIDRSARNLRDWAELGDLIDRGMDVRFVSDNFDLLSRGGRLSADIQAVVAADYIRNLREEVKKGMYGRLKQGIYPFAAPIGYLNTGRAKPKVIDPVKGPLIRALFERYATSTVSFEELRYEFARYGLTTRVGKPVALNTLTNILNNPFYAGVMRVRTTGETFVGVHEPLISQALFERVHGILRGKTVPKAKKHQFLFRQVVRCENCGCRTLTAEHQKSHTYYRCHGRNCRGISWREDELEAALLKQIGRIRLSAGDVGTLGMCIEDIYRSMAQDTEHSRASIQLRQAHVQARLEKLTDLLLDGAIDKAVHDGRREKLLLEQRQLAAEHARADCASPLKDLCELFERNNGALLQYELLLDDEKRELMNIVCSNFSASRENVVITLRSPYREIAESADLEECEHHRDKVRMMQIAYILVRFTDQVIEHGVLPMRSISRPLVPTSPDALMEVR